MARCEKCGADIQASVRYCPYCGKEQNVSTYSEPDYRRYQGSGGGHYDPRPEYSSEFDPRDIEDNRVLSVLCYFNLLLLIPLLTRPYSQYIKFHANQGILLLLVSVASGAVAVIPILGWLAAAVGGVFSFICLVLGVINSLNGRARPLPIIGKYSVLR